MNNCDSSKYWLPQGGATGRRLKAWSIIGLLAVAIGCGPTGTNQASARLPSYQSSTTQSQSAMPPAEANATPAKTTAESESQTKVEPTMETATFGAGCFWCVEAVFQKLKGVETVRSGYMGGRVPNPSYEQICGGLTGHAEVIQIEFNPTVITFPELLEVFWSTHDPTTLNRQGNDSGTQYRSAVFFHNEEQRKAAEEYKDQLNKTNAFPDPVVTEITQASKMYEAEDYHQNFYNENPNQGYCRAIIPAKLDKLKKVFADKLKQE